MERARYAQHRPPVARPAGIAVGAITAAAAGYDPAAPRCHMASQARYGASVTCDADRAAMAVAASQTTSIGRLHSAARYSRPGGHPARQATATPRPATSETGAAATTSAAAARIRAARNAARPTARPGRRPAACLLTVSLPLACQATPRPSTPLAAVPAAWPA